MSEVCPQVASRPNHESRKPLRESSGPQLSRFSGKLTADDQRGSNTVCAGSVSLPFARVLHSVGRVSGQPEDGKGGVPAPRTRGSQPSGRERPACLPAQVQGGQGLPSLGPGSRLRSSKGDDPGCLFSGQPFTLGLKDRRSEGKGFEAGETSLGVLPLGLWSHSGPWFPHL